MIDKGLSNEDLAILAQSTDDENIKREALQELYISNLPLIRSFVVKYQQSGVTLDDLMQAAFLGIASAVSSYDPIKGRFFSFARFHIKNECLSLLRSSIFSFSLSAASFERVYHYKKGLQELNQKLGRVPTDKEVCSFMDISQATLDNLKMLIASPVSLDSPVPLASGDDEITFADFIQDFNTDVENDTLDKMNNERLSDDLWSFLQEKVDGRAYDFLRLHFCENKTYDEIGDIYKVSRQRVQQVIASTFEMLRSRDSSLIRLLSELESVGISSVYKTSFGRFEREGSSVEKIVMKRDEKKTEIIKRLDSEKEKSVRFHHRRYYRRRSS